MAKAAGAKEIGRKAAVTLKVALRGVRPPIWRRLVVPGSVTLAELHRVIQGAMGWYDCHLHGFEIGGRHYGQPGVLEGVTNENRATLNGVVNSGARRFTYAYDFGDSWEHLITIEKVEHPKAGEVSPACIAGKRACPPEDCGGPWGYVEPLEILADPEHSEHQERLEWLDDGLDPEAFDLARANLRVESFIGRS